MTDHNGQSPVRIIGSRELHQGLPAILSALRNDDVRYVLTVHGKPRAVLVGPQAYLKIALERRGDPTEAMASLQLSALLGEDSDFSIEVLSEAPAPRPGQTGT